MISLNINLFVLCVFLFSYLMTGCRESPRSNKISDSEFALASDLNVLKTELNQLRVELQTVKLATSRTADNAARNPYDVISAQWLVGSWTVYTDEDLSPVSRKYFSFIDTSSLIACNGLESMHNNFKPTTRVASYNLTSVTKDQLTAAIKEVKKVRWSRIAPDPDFSASIPSHLLQMDIYFLDSETKQIEASIRYSAISLESSTGSNIPGLRDLLIMGKLSLTKEDAINNFYDRERDRIQLARFKLEPFLLAKDLPSTSRIVQPEQLISKNNEENITWVANVPNNDPMLVAAKNYLLSHANCQGSDLMWEIGASRGFPENSLIQELKNVEVEINVQDLNQADKLNNIQSKFSAKIRSKAWRSKKLPQDIWGEWMQLAPWGSNMILNFIIMNNETTVTPMGLNDVYSIRPVNQNEIKTR